MLLAVAAVLAFNVCAHAQSDDWHMSSRDLFVKSTFAHGYIHGYEEGFHAGDIDMQMGRSYREMKCQEKFKKPAGYRDQFGSKGTYDDGYRKGYTVGYIDSYEGRNFRAIQLIRAAQASNDRSGWRLDQEFDSAFRQGYEAGQSKGLQDGRTSVAAQNEPASCEEKLQAKGGSGLNNNYCDAFRSGYQLGYSDGFANQRDRGKVLAKK
jgi:flagellar biosynthesis/type III secretory pathway protein FliH